jgi:hypothetical protein
LVMPRPVSVNSQTSQSDFPGAEPRLGPSALKIGFHHATTYGLAMFIK